VSEHNDRDPNGPTLPNAASPTSGAEDGSNDQTSKKPQPVAPSSGGPNTRGIPASHGSSSHGWDDDGPVYRPQTYGALDLGTNNCRLLLAKPSRRGFMVVDAFSRIIRLGEGVSQSGRLSDAAMDRTIDALRVCAAKLARSGTKRARCVATEACRVASNGEHFLSRVRNELGLEIEVLSREAEAGLAVAGCATLIDYRSDYVLVFDIGGGSSELVWLDLTGTELDDEGNTRLPVEKSIAAWTSLPTGVVTLAEKFGGRHVTPSIFEAMVAHVEGLIRPFENAHQFRHRISNSDVHFLGTSGTVTTVAGIYLKLPRYDRSRVDGCWLNIPDVRGVTSRLVGNSYEERVAEPCIGPERADLVLAGCAILEAILRTWPSDRLRVADRGLREGILTTLMTEDGVYRTGRRRRLGGNGRR
jgi:exopolyphosphatase / guanosine-5'-triphosphate,3'-diphosphate pyrophosphatase